MRLSHTAKELYIRCPLAYHMHYNLKYRHKITGSPLLFGNAIDIGLNALLNGKTEVEALVAFQNAWEEQEINGETVKLKDCPYIKYSKADKDETLINSDVIASCQDNDYLSWLSLEQKGIMMIKQYNQQIIPQIKEVISVQENFSIPNGSGDYITGVIDLVCKWHDNRIIVFDNKTSSKKYSEDKIETEGDQLALYDAAVAEKYCPDAVGYIPLVKDIRKKKLPRVVIQDNLIGQVPEDLKQKVFDEFDDVLYSIRMGRFPSNHPNCNTYFGKCMCDKYYPSEGVDTSELVQVTRRKKQQKTN